MALLDSGAERESAGESHRQKEMLKGTNETVGGIHTVLQTPASQVIHLQHFRYECCFWARIIFGSTTCKICAKLLVLFVAPPL